MEKRLQREQKTLTRMIALYCTHHHNTGDKNFCPDCQSMRDYALQRTERCPFGAAKPTCAKCPIHCYQTEMKQRIREVMRYSGPRMIFWHPWLALLHLVDSFRPVPDR